MSLGLLLHGIYLTIPDTSFQKSNVDKGDWVRFITKEKCVTAVIRQLRPEFKFPVKIEVAFSQIISHLRMI